MRLEVWVVGQLTEGAGAAIEWEANVISPKGATHLKGANIVQVRDGRLSELHVYFVAVG